MSYTILVGTATYPFIPPHATSPASATSSSIFTLSFSPKSGTQLRVTSHYSSAGGNPSWLALSKDKTLLLACNESQDNADHSQLATFRLEPKTGQIVQKLSSSTSCAIAPCYSSLANNDSVALVANYFPSVLCSFPITSGGQLSSSPTTKLAFSDPSHAHTDRQSSAHGHCIIPHPTRPHHVYSADLGADKIRLLTMGAKGELRHIKDFPTARADGPRQIAFHPSGDFLFCLQELSRSVSLYSVLRDGDLGFLQNVRIDAPDSTSSDDKQFRALSAAAIRVSPDGRFIYASMRNDATHPNGDCITVLSFSNIPASRMEIVQYARPNKGGWHIRDLSLSPDGLFLVSGSMAEGGEVVVWRRDQETGHVSELDRLILSDDEGRIIAPACFVWL